MITKPILFRDPEPSIEQSLECFADNYKNLKFIKFLHEAHQDHDEIKFHQFITKVELTPEETEGRIFKHDSHPGGSSLFSKDIALVKCLGESVERISTQSYFDKNQIYSTYKKLKQIAINPTIISLSLFTKKQLTQKDYIKYRVTENSQLSWTSGCSLFNFNEILIPTQLVYYSYKHKSEEGVFGPLISTGAAGGGSLSAATLRGIYEIVERDSFMIFYLNRLAGKKINLTSIADKRIKKALEVCERYRLSWHAINITSDLEIPVIVSILVDETGIGSAVSVGLKADCNQLDAIVGSFEESLHVRNYARHAYEDSSHKKLAISEITNIKTRAIYWHEKSMIKHLDFWLQQKEEISGSQIKTPTLTKRQSLKTVEKLLKKHKIDCFFKDITRKDVQRIPYYVVKVIMPQLCPVFLDERYPFLGCKRLYSVPTTLGYKQVPSLNSVPHPFL